MVAALRRLERATIEARDGFWRCTCTHFSIASRRDGLRLLAIDVTDAREPREVRAFDVKATVRARKSCRSAISC